VKQLVWYEVCEEPLVAIAREKQIKKWNRGWKLKLIEKKNPEWRDLFTEICQ
jgi:putative endonuclease